MNFFVAMCKLHYLIKGGDVVIQTDHKSLLEIMSGTTKVQNSAATEKLRRWTHNIMATQPPPKIEYKKGSSNLIADSLSHLSTREHYIHDTPLKNTEPLKLVSKQINMVQTRASKAKENADEPKLPELQIKVRDIFKTSDKWQLIQNADKILEELSPEKLRELQDKDQSICNMRRSRKFNVITDDKNILRVSLDYKGSSLNVIILPKVLCPPHCKQA